MIYYQYVKTTNDTNGNPRRLYVTFNDLGHTGKVYEEGYVGFPAELQGRLKSIELGLGIHVTPKEYNEIKRRAKVDGRYVAA